jgi:outer membrane protein assembly factor BamA
MALTMPRVLHASAMPPDTLLNRAKVPLIKRIEDFARKDNIFAKMLSSVWVFESGVQPVGLPDTTKVSDNPYLKYNGSYIRDLKIVVLDPFGYAVDAEKARKINWFQRQGNRLHYETRDWVIEERLLFRKGEKVEALKISESERLVRQSPGILDARIILTPVGKDSVDALVVAQDVWSLNGAVAVDMPGRTGSVNVDDGNFIGLGHQFVNNVSYNSQFSNKWQYSGRYFVPEIANTFINGEAHYNTQDTNRRYGFSLQRPFFSSAMHWAGGISMEAVRAGFVVPFNDSLTFSGNHKYRSEDVWIGYAFNPKDRKRMIARKSQYMLGARIIHTEYLDRDVYNEFLNKYFGDHSTFLGTVAFAHRDYYKDRFIFGFGRTEDIPLGYIASVTSGVDFKGALVRPYIGLSLGYGANHSALGYSSVSLDFGSFLNNGELDEGAIRAQMLYFTNMLNIGSWQVRQFFWTRMIWGIRRPYGEFIDINGDNGLRGFNSQSLKGTEKLAVNYEIDFFTPYHPLGFRIVPVIFADFAWIGSGSSPLFHNRLFQGYGIGLRLRNEHLVFPTFEISAHYFPGASAWGGKDFSFYQTSNPYYRYQSFQFNQPYTVGL